MAIVPKPTASGDANGSTSTQTASAVARNLPNENLAKEQEKGQSTEKGGAIGAMLAWFADSLGLSNEDKQHLVTGGESALSGNSSPDVARVKEVAQDQATKVTGIPSHLLALAGKEGSVFQKLTMNNVNPAARFDGGVSAGRMHQTGMALA